MKTKRGAAAWTSTRSRGVWTANGSDENRQDHRQSRHQQQVCSVTCLSTTSARAATILVIDDQAEVRSGLSAVLSAAGHQCHAAADDRSASDLAARIHPDLILCDVNLQGVNGIELCERLKQFDGLADVPTMFLSSTQTPDIIRRAHAYHIRKLLDPQVILQLVEQALAEIADRHLAHA